MYKLADLMERDAEELAQLETLVRLTLLLWYINMFAAPPQVVRC